MKINIRFSSILLIIVLCFNSRSYPTSRLNIKQATAPADFVTGQIVVKFDSNLVNLIDKAMAAATGRTGIPILDQAAAEFGVSSMRQRFPRAKLKYYQGRRVDLRGWFKVNFDTLFDAGSVIDALNQIPGIIDSQPIGIHPVDAVPNDTYFYRQWHLNQNNDHDVDAPEAWDLQTGNSSIIVGILDTGVRYYHKDLGGGNASPSTPENSRGNMWINNTELSAGISNGIDDDGNGYIDDWIGWDFVDNVSLSFLYSKITGEDYDIQDKDPRDFNGHGTHCAGNISALNNNGIGLNSVSGGWSAGGQVTTGNGVRTMPLRIGYSANSFMYGEVGLVQMDFAAEAMYYAADNGARIISCSWGSSNDAGLADAIDYFLASGGLIFKSAGNSGNATADYMCSRSDPNLISVAATDSNDIRADFSNYGNWVDISAPGTRIWSTYHDHNDPATDYYTGISGTSMASPIAASVAALIWSANPSLSADQVRQILFDNADNIDAGNPSYIGQLGAGRVNAFNAMNDASLPVELISFSGKLTPEGIRLEWETGSEIENAGFELYRSSSRDKGYARIASYQEFPELRGLINSTIGRRYVFVDRQPLPDEICWYKLYDIDINGRKTESGAIQISREAKYSLNPLNNVIPSNPELYQNYPNPFNISTIIRFAVPDGELLKSRLGISIFNVNGQKIRTLYKGQLKGGIYEINWDGTDNHNQPVPSGVYVCTMTCDENKWVRKLILIK